MSFTKYHTSAFRICKISDERRRGIKEKKEDDRAIYVSNPISIDGKQNTGRDLRTIPKFGISFPFSHSSELVNF